MNSLVILVELQRLSSDSLSEYTTIPSFGLADLESEATYDIIKKKTS
jgi:hypothetical protein